MGKAAREARRELEAQAAMAMDLNRLQTRPFLIAGIQVDAIDMMTPMGKTPGARLTFHMQNGNVHEPIIFDPIMALQTIASMALAITNPAALAATQGSPTPEPPGPADVTPSDETDIGPEQQTPSGLIIPS